MLLEWLYTNKVWVNPTMLSSTHHVSVGWLLQFHPTYEKYARVTIDLLHRIGIEGAELELSPHTIPHTTAHGDVLKHIP